MQLTFLPEEPPARRSASPASEPDWLTLEETSPSPSLGLSLNISPASWFGKMSPVSCRSTEDGRLEPSSGGWQNSGMGGPTGSLTLSSPEHLTSPTLSHSDGAVCSLSDILETGDVPQRYYLTARACAGILRRAEKRGKTLPTMLHQALSAVAGELSGGGDTRGQDPVIAVQEVVSTIDASFGRLQGASGQDANHGHSHLVPLAFGGNDTRGPIEVATARNAHAGPHGRLDFESETFIADPIAFSIMPMNSGKDYKGRQTDVAQPLMATMPGNSGAQGGDYIAQPIPFDTTQITHPENRSNPQPGDAAGSLPAAGHAPAIAFNARQDPDVWSGVTGPIDTDAYTQAVAYDMRGREGGAQMEGPHDTANIRAASGGSRRSYVQTAWRVRRLTPTECERLQGMPDGYTQIPQGNKPTADGPRYKQLGNSWAVNVPRVIGERIDMVDKL